MSYSIVFKDIIVVSAFASKIYFSIRTELHTLLEQHSNPFVSNSGFTNLEQQIQRTTATKKYCWKFHIHYLFLVHAYRVHCIQCFVCSFEFLNQMKLRFLHKWQTHMKLFHCVLIKRKCAQFLQFPTIAQFRHVLQMRNQVIKVIQRLYHFATARFESPSV